MRKLLKVKKISNYIQKLFPLWQRTTKNSRKAATQKKSRKNSVMNEFTFLRDTLYGRTMYDEHHILAKGDEWRFLFGGFLKHFFLNWFDCCGKIFVGSLSFLCCILLFWFLNYVFDFFIIFRFCKWWVLSDAEFFIKKFDEIFAQKLQRNFCFEKFDKFFIFSWWNFRC